MTKMILDVPSEISRQMDDIVSERNATLEVGEPTVTKPLVARYLVELGLPRHQALRTAQENPIPHFDQWQGLTREKRAHWQKTLLERIEEGRLDLEACFEALESFKEVFMEPGSWGVSRDVPSVYQAIRDQLIERVEQLGGFIHLANFEVRTQAEEERDYSHDPVWRQLSAQLITAQEAVKIRQQELDALPGEGKEELYQDDVITAEPPQVTKRERLLTLLKR